MSQSDILRNEEVLRAERVAQLEGALPEVLGRIAADYRKEIERDLYNMRHEVAKARRTYTPEFVQSVYAEALGKTAGEMRAQWQSDLEAIRSEARATIAEFKSAMLEAELARHDPAAAAKLRSITGGRT